ncbi:hypothetical protein LEP1GSC050_2580 [Leptospira broomii serovar Hurstbridge str. 5399]|uniref:Uncharacterized protein n=1 Tax=Leptospira broomii serovar Hurstbridge str. 5399 TaxID=1049789 RepID=T0EZJ6_9LEPT|nr:hypothetical protein LEP1GSC050_2580 [Leptospira broomii serovar Hurstbridge str. 5399]
MKKSDRSRFIIFSHFTYIFAILDPFRSIPIFVLSSIRKRICRHLHPKSR